MKKMKNKIIKGFQSNTALAVLEKNTTTSS